MGNNIKEFGIRNTLIRQLMLPRHTKGRHKRLQRTDLAFVDPSLK